MERMDVHGIYMVKHVGSMVVFARDVVGRMEGTTVEEAARWVGGRAAVCVQARTLHIQQRRSTKRRDGSETHRQSHVGRLRTVSSCRHGGLDDGEEHGKRGTRAGDRGDAYLAAGLADEVPRDGQAEAGAADGRAAVLGLRARGEERIEDAFEVFGGMPQPVSWTARAT